MDGLPVQPDLENRRTAQRIAVDSLAVVSAHDRDRTTRLVNVSAGGALIGPLFGVTVGDRVTLNVPGYGAIVGWVARITGNNHAAVCFSPDPDFHELCEERSDELVEIIKNAQLALQNPIAARNHVAG